MGSFLFFFQEIDQFAYSGGLYLCDEDFAKIQFFGGMCDELVEPETEYCDIPLESSLEPPTKAPKTLSAMYYDDDSDRDAYVTDSTSGNQPHFS